MFYNESVLVVCIYLPGKYLLFDVYSSTRYLSGTAPGPCLNIKTVLSAYGDFHVKDKTAVRTSYL